MSFYLARLEAAREQHRQRMMAAAAAAAGNAAHAPRAWPPYPQDHAALLPRPEQHHPPVPPLHAGSSRVVVDTWRGGGGGSVARRDDDGAPLPRAGGSLIGVGGVAGSATGATTTAREETGGGGVVGNKRPLAPTTPRPRSPPPKRRAVVAAAAAARRLFPPGCGRDDAALPLARCAEDGGASRPVAARGDGDDGGSGAPHRSALLPRRPALAGGSVLFDPAASPSAAAAAAGGGGGSSSISALEKVPASDGAAGVTTDDGGHGRQGLRLVKSSEASGRNGWAAAAATAGALMAAADSQSQQGAAGPGRLMPKPTTVSANRRFPPGCRRHGAPLPAADRDGTTNQVACPPSPEEEAQESQVSSSVTLNYATPCAVEVYASHTCSVERIGNKWHCEEMTSSAVPATDANVTYKPDGSSCNVVAAESLAQGLSKEGHRSESVSECGPLNSTCSDDFAAAAPMSGEGAVMRKKVMHTPRKSVRPPKSIQKSLLNTQRRPFSMAIERETEKKLGWSVNMNEIEDTGVFNKAPAIQDPPISANKSTWTNGKEAKAAAYFGPKKRVSKKKLNKKRFTVKGRSHPTMKVASSSCTLGGIEKLEDDEIFKALAAHETKFEFGPQITDARSKVKLIYTRFESICRAIVQAAGHRSMKVRRIDLAADKLIRKLPGFTKQQGPVVGSVPGVEVGDEFLYRAQLALVGLHRPFQGGIDATRHESGVRIAISVVASGGYPDELSSSSGELVYTGSGKKDNGDQKLEHGNLALKNCIGTKTPVRVIHGFKDQNRVEGSHSRAREVSTFTYDGLYRVVDCWREGSPGSKVFKYRLQRIPGQPQLSLHKAKAPW